MIYWIVFCNIWINFVFGALVPMTPQINEKMAGVAFSAFALMKVLIFVPSGYVSDRLGHFWGFAIALISQFITLFLIFYFPEYIWFARLFEGVTLAFGTVSALALFRLYSSNETEFSRGISLLLGIGSVGFLIGPFYGFNIELHDGLKYMMYFALAVSVLHFAFLKLHENSLKGFQMNESDGHDQHPIKMVVAFSFVKALAVGTEPIFAWWAIEKIGLSKELAGFTFVFGAFGFMSGNYFKKLNYAYFGLLGLFFVELALQWNHLFWWPAMVFVGLFSGTMVNICLSELGWNKPENLGVKNAKWLALSDIPMMLTPALLWELRGDEHSVFRFLFLISVVFITLELVRRSLKVIKN